jgi:hypothetical protein
MARLRRHGLQESTFRLRDELGFFYLTLFEKDFEHFAPVLAKLEGR